MDEDKKSKEGRELVYDENVGWEPSEMDRLDQPPVEVFEAIDGNRKVLVDYLRSGEPLSLYTIEALAAWLAGELPAKRPPGNPHGTAFKRNWNSVGMGLALLEYRRIYADAGRPKGEADKYAIQVAEERGIDTEKFLIYRRKSAKQKHVQPDIRPFLESMWWEWKDQR